ncbi:MAG: peptidyl-prolyl cis-trans isomerase [bacterium]|nr:peptidyl-prolyl cis-trans isomerase [bacterium]
MMFRRMGAATVTALLLIAGPVRAEVVNRIVATIDGEPITERELRRYAAQHAREGMSDGQVLDAFITDKLLDKEVEAKGIKITDVEVDRYIEQVKVRGRLDDQKFNEALAQQGLTPEEYRVRIKGELEKSQLVNREIRGRVNVTPEEVQRYYDANKDRFAVASGVTVRGILVEVGPADGSDAVAHAQSRAEEARAKALAGEDFGALAAEYSDGPGANSGGVFGTFKQGEMDPTLERAVFSLRPGEVSEVVRTGRGFFVLKVDQNEVGGHRSLAEVKDEIRERLYGEQIEKRFEDWLSRELRERHSVEVLN